MRLNTFAGSLVFAAAAAAGLVPVVLVLTPWVGTHAGLALYLVGVAVVYLRGLVPDGRRGKVVFGATLAVGVTAAACLRSVGELALILAITLAVVRSAVVFGLPLTRAVAMETLLVGGGLLFARTVGGTALSGWALGLWSFLLVQSVYFLFAGTQLCPASQVRSDAFADAYERALALLERREV